MYDLCDLFDSNQDEPGKYECDVYRAVPVLSLHLCYLMIFEYRILFTTRSLSLPSYRICRRIYVAVAWNHAVVMKFLGWG